MRQAVRMFFNQIAHTGKVPLSLDWANKTPNARTLEAIHELEEGGGTRYESAEEAMQAMFNIAAGNCDA